MLEIIAMLVLGISIVCIGIINFKGNVQTIHWYNRKKITDSNVKQYGKVMGIGTMLIGVGLILTSILKLFIESEYIFYIIKISCGLGLITMLYGQFKYNKGIF